MTSEKRVKDSVTLRGHPSLCYPRLLIGAGHVWVGMMGNGTEDFKGQERWVTYDAPSAGKGSFYNTVELFLWVKAKVANWWPTGWIHWKDGCYLTFPVLYKRSLVHNMKDLGISHNTLNFGLLLKYQCILGPNSAHNRSQVELSGGGFFWGTCVLHLPTPLYCSLALRLDVSCHLSTHFWSLFSLSYLHWRLCCKKNKRAVEVQNISIF